MFKMMMMLSLECYNVNEVLKHSSAVFEDTFFSFNTLHVIHSSQCLSSLIISVLLCTHILSVIMCLEKITSLDQLRIRILQCQIKSEEHRGLFL